jgi:hypothetical protein
MSVLTFLLCLARMSSNNTKVERLNTGAVALWSPRLITGLFLFLDLDKNQIGDAGITELARAFMVNSSLMHLWIKGNFHVIHKSKRVLVESVPT